jgi:hypothetical protein
MLIAGRFSALTNVVNAAMMERNATTMTSKYGAFILLAASMPLRLLGVIHASQILCFSMTESAVWTQYGKQATSDNSLTFLLAMAKYLALQMMIQ